MSISISVRNGEVKDRLKAYAKQKAEDMMAECDKLTAIEMILDAEKNRYQAEVILRGKNLKIESKQEAYDINEAVDTAIEKVGKQLRKYMDKKVDSHVKPGKPVKAKDDGLEVMPGTEEYID